MERAGAPAPELGSAPRMCMRGLLSRPIARASSSSGTKSSMSNEQGWEWDRPGRGRWAAEALSAAGKERKNEAVPGPLAELSHGATNPSPQ
eukprot:scaffold15002_cov131-Isochrysis_galbana.AAC.2